jgi:hypothetical protein
MELTHRWIGKNFLPERHGQRLMILIKAKRSRACLVQFEDGHLAMTNVALLRRLHDGQDN